MYHEQIPRKSAATEEPNRRFYFPTQKKGVPYFDKVDRLKIFQVEQREHVYFYSLPYPVCRGIYRIDDWIERETDDPMDRGMRLIERNDWIYGRKDSISV